LAAEFVVRILIDNRGKPTPLLLECLRGRITMRVF
jgi:hypothetical protein